MKIRVLIVSNISSALTNSYLKSKRPLDVTNQCLHKSSEISIAFEICVPNVYVYLMNYNNNKQNLDMMQRVLHMYRDVKTFENHESNISNRITESCFKLKSSLGVTELVLLTSKRV